MVHRFVLGHPLHRANVLAVQHNLHTLVDARTGAGAELIVALLQSQLPVTHRQYAGRLISGIAQVHMASATVPSASWLFRCESARRRTPQQPTWALEFRSACGNAVHGYGVGIRRMNYTTNYQ